MKAQDYKKELTEDQFLAQVIDLAHLYGWFVAHFRPAMTAHGWRTPVQGHKGYPDIVLVRKPRVLFCELKSEKGRLSPEQEDWQSVLSQCPGVEYYLWCPSSFDALVEILQQKGKER